MSTPHDASRSPSPWTAALLSFLAPGLGQLRLGRTTSGVSFYFAPFLILPAMIAHARAGAPLGVVIGLLVPALVVLALHLAAPLHAFVVARRERHAHPDVLVRGPLAAVVFLVAGMAVPVALADDARAIAFEAFVVPTGSMEPTIFPGDRILAWKSANRIEPPRRGSVVIHRMPGARGTLIVKRLIALPGDTVRMEHGQVFVNDAPLAQRPAPGVALQTEESDGRRYAVLADADDVASLVIPRDCCFVLGDHRANSQDSRHYGCVPLGDVVAEAAFLYASRGDLSRIGRIE